MRHDPVGACQPTRSRRRLQARRAAVAAAGIAVLTAAGCSSAATMGGPVAKPITIAAVAGYDTAPIYLAQSNGDFAAAGLSHVVIKSYLTDAGAVAAVAHGQADIAASDYGDIFAVQSQSPDLRVLADGYDAAPGMFEIVALPGTITGPAQLENVKIGVPNDQLMPVASQGTTRPASLEVAAATQVLENYLGAGALSTNWQPMSEQQEMNELEQHKLPAVLITEPYISEAETQLGAVEVMDAYNGATAGLPLTGYVATNAWVKANPAAVADFQAALGKAKADATMAGAVQPLLPLPNGVSLTDLDLATIGTYPASTSVSGLQRVVGLLANFRFIPSAAAQAPKIPAMIVKPGS